MAAEKKRRGQTLCEDQGVVDSWKVDRRGKGTLPRQTDGALVLSVQSLGVSWCLPGESALVPRASMAPLAMRKRRRTRPRAHSVDSMGPITPTAAGHSSPIQIKKRRAGLE